MGNLIRIGRGPSTLRIPRPVAAGVDDRFAVFEVDDESYLPCFMPGAALVFRWGCQFPDVFHIVNLGEGAIVVRLRPEPTGYTVVSCCKDSPSGFFKATEIDLIGTVRELYPFGIHGPRMVNWRVVQKHIGQFERPVLTASAR